MKLVHIICSKSWYHTKYTSHCQINTLLIYYTVYWAYHNDIYRNDHNGETSPKNLNRCNQLQKLTNVFLPLHNTANFRTQPIHNDKAHLFLRFAFFSHYIIVIGMLLTTKTLGNYKRYAWGGILRILGFRKRYRQILYSGPHSTKMSNDRLLQ